MRITASPLRFALECWLSGAVKLFIVHAGVVMIVGGCVGSLATSTDTVQFFVSARSAWVFGAYNAIWAARKYGSLMTCYASSISLYLVYRIS